MFYETRLLDGLNDRNNSLRTALDYLNSGEPIAFPTETVYGLGVRIDDLRGVEAIYAIKNRSKNQPLAAHISRIEQINELCSIIPDNFYRLAEKFLPGPLAIIMRRSDKVDKSITSGFDTISIRFPSNKLCLEFIEAVGIPLAATSANISGNESAKTGKQAFDNLNGKIAAVLDGGETEYQLESTIISIVDEPKILRVGVIPQNEVLECIDAK